MAKRTSRSGKSKRRDGTIHANRPNWRRVGKDWIRV